MCGRLSPVNPPSHWQSGYNLLHSQTDVSEASEVLLQFGKAAKAYAATCHTDPSQWHRPDVAEFIRLHDLLLPHAESGDAQSQYALATIYSLGLCCETEEAFAQTRQALTEKATPWWIAAATQGHL